MEPLQVQPIYGKEEENLSNDDCTDEEAILNKECRKYLGKYNLSGQKILKIKDSLIGIVDSILNSYLEGFK